MNNLFNASLPRALNIMRYWFCVQYFRFPESLKPYLRIFRLNSLDSWAFSAKAALNTGMKNSMQYSNWSFLEIEAFIKYPPVQKVFRYAQTFDKRYVSKYFEMKKNLP